jgi:hypothetical protein
MWIKEGNPTGVLGLPAHLLLRSSSSSSLKLSPIILIQSIACNNGAQPLPFLTLHERLPRVGEAAPWLAGGEVQWEDAVRNPPAQQPAAQRAHLLHLIRLGWLAL